MAKNGSRALFYWYWMQRTCLPIDIPSESCSQANDFKKCIEKNRQYRNIVICKAEYVNEIKNIIIDHCTDQIFILGRCPELQIKHKEITIVTNERDLCIHLLHAAICYTYDEAMTHRELGNYGVADMLLRDTLQLLDQFKIFP